MSIDVTDPTASGGHVLFVCTGNTCRSPLAAAVAHRAGVVATSAGLDAVPGAPASAGARSAATDAGLTLEAHLSRAATEPVVAAAGTIYAMTTAQTEQLRRRWPEFAARIHRLDPEGDIDDPFGGDDATYRATLTHIESAVAARLGSEP